MIISDTHQFVFVHIPKCAGTFVRKHLQFFDSREGKFTGRVNYHPVFGTLDYVHIPLFILKDHFQKEFEAVRDYWSFVVVRDPFARFASSVSQRLKMYSDTPIQKRSLVEIRTSIDESINYLSHQPLSAHLLPPDYIHFQPQIDFIELEGERIVDAIYSVDSIDALLSDVGRRVGQTLKIQGRQQRVPRSNQTVVFRSESLRWLFVRSRFVTHALGRVLPEKVKQIAGELLYVPRDQRLNELFCTDCVQDFIREYYALDIAMFHKVKVAEEDRSP